MRKCGKCGKSGHNSRTCTAKKKSSPQKKRARVKSPVQRACGVCGKKGHNARTCDYEVVEEKTVRTCGKCGKAGHNARTCGKSATPAKRSPAKRSPAKRSPKITRGETKVAEVQVEPKSGRKCGKCGEAGHNARTCKAPAQAVPVVKEPEDDKPQARKLTETVKFWPSRELSKEELRERALNGADLQRSVRLAAYEKLVKWLASAHGIKATRLTSDGFVKGQTIYMVETHLDDAPLAVSRATISAVDRETEMLHYKIEGYDGSPCVSFDYILDLTVGGRTRYYFAAGN